MDALACVEVDLAALQRNFEALSQAVRPGDCGAVVKADAYGLGLRPVARKLRDSGCRHFFVATPSEGLQLREILPEEEIFVLNGLKATTSEELVSANLQPVLNTRAELEAWGPRGPAAVHIDTGMSRLGLTAADIDALRLEGDLAPAVDVRYVLTHLACADEPDHALNRAQLESFHELRSLWPDAATSIGNSAGVMLGREFGSDLARPGIALYGGDPFRRLPGAVEPVVEVKARILQIKEIDPGTTIGYGATFVASDRMRIAVIALGYADGYLRSLGNCGIATISGQRVPVVGRVSMDLVCVDVTALSADEVAEGDWATMIGGAVTLDEIATLAGTISYELLTSLGHRVERIYLDDHATGERPD